MVNWFNGFSAIWTLQTGFSKVHVPFQFLQNIAVAVIASAQFGPDSQHADANMFDAEYLTFLTLISDHASHKFPSISFVKWSVIVRIGDVSNG